MIKILYLVPSLRKCGPTNQLTYLIENCNKKFDITLCIISKANIENDLINYFLSLGINIIFKKSFLDFHKIISNNKFDIIHTQGLKADLYAFIFANRDKHILTSRNNPRLDYPAKFGNFIGYFMAFVHLFIQRRMKNVVACSKSLNDQLSDYNIKSLIIKNGVRIPNLSHIVSNINKPKFVAVGSLIKRKNYEKTIDIFNYLPDFELYIYGEGVLQKKLMKQSGSNIKFMGFSKNIIDELFNYDFFISNSYAEGLPNTVLEASSLGLPLILSNINSHIEITNKLSHSLIINNDDSSKNISEYIRNFIIGISKSINISLKNDFKTNFSSELMANNYMDLYNKIFYKIN